MCRQLRVRAAAGHEAEHLELALGEGGEAIGRRPAGGRNSSGSRRVPVVGEVPSLVAGLVANAWIAAALVTGGRREGDAAETPDRAAAAVS